MMTLLLSMYDIWLSLNELVFINALQAQPSITAQSVLTLYEHQLTQDKHKPLSLAISAGVGVAILIWLYQAKVQCIRLGARDTRYTPLASIGCYFIPILNLWRPYYTMQELYRGSLAPHSWQQAPSTWLIPIWWAFLLAPIVSMLLYWPYVSMVWLSPQDATLMSFTWLNQCSLTISMDNLLCTAALYWLVHRINKAQLAQLAA